MASSTCVKCGNSSFELKKNEPHGGKFKLYFVQCRTCGGVVGVQEFFNVSQMIVEQNKIINKIAMHLGIPSRLQE